jgi:sterol 14-demethylase
MTWRIVVDRDLCQGHGVCESEAPEVFVVERKATTVTVLDETPPETQRAAVEAAVRYCPTPALSIEEIE